MLVVLEQEHAALAVDPCDEVLAPVGQVDRDRLPQVGQLARDARDERLGALPRQRGHAHRIGMALLTQPSVEVGQPVRVRPVDLVQHDDLTHRVRTDLDEHLPDRIDLVQRSRMRRVHHVQQQRRLRGLLEGRAERLDEPVRQLAHETDGVGQDGLTTVAEVEPPQRRVERREQAVLDQHIGACQPVQQRRLPGVRVAHERDHREATALATGGLDRTRPGRILQLTTDRGDPPHQASTVDLELRLARTATTDANAAGRASAGLP